MFEHRKFQRELKSLLKRVQRTEAAFDDEIRKAKLEGKQSEIRKIEQQRQWEVELINDEIGVLSSNYWIEQAHIYQVAVLYSAPLENAALLVAVAATHQG